MVECHSGRLWAESDGEGKGSVFRFVIPCNPPAISTDDTGEDLLKEAIAF
jgi:signal transduction histidine kinase